MFTKLWPNAPLKNALTDHFPNVNWFVQPNSSNQSLNQLFDIYASSTLFLQTRHIFILSLWKYQPNKKAIQKPVKIINNTFIIIQRLGMSKNGFFLSAFCRASQWGQSILIRSAIFNKYAQNFWLVNEYLRKFISTT